MQIAQSKNNTFLIIGPRKNLIEELDLRGAVYFVWKDDECKLHCNSAKKILHAPYNFNSNESSEVYHWLKQIQNIVTNVIVASERAIPIADKVREFLKIKTLDHDRNNILRCEYPLMQLCTDKYLMKQYLQQFDIPMTKFQIVDQNSNIDEIIKHLGFPIVMKERISTGGRDLKIASTKTQLMEYLSNSKILETHINGIEGSVESFIQNGRIIFTNITSYLEKKHCNLVPSNLAQGIKEKVLSLNFDVISALHIKHGITHLEFYKTEQGLLFGEIAIRPPGGYIMDLIQHSYGFNPWSVYIDIECEQNINLHHIKHKNFSLAHVFHPGERKINDVTGLKNAKKIKSVEKIKFKKIVGKNISRRNSTGEDVGYAILKNTCLDELIQDWKQVKNSIVFC